MHNFSILKSGGSAFRYGADDTIGVAFGFCV